MTAPTLDVYDDQGVFSSQKVADIYSASKGWPPQRKKAALLYLQAAAKREEIKRKYANTAEIAHSVDPDFVITPAIKTIADAIEVVLNRPRHNLIVTMPPQEGKSTLCAVFAPIRAWQLNPNRRVIVATYGDDLALQHSTACRTWIENHGSDVTDSMTGTAVEDKIGLKLSPRSKRMDAFRIDGARGGLVAAGLGSAITGRPADLFIIDDPYKNMQEADSETHRNKVDEWMRTVAMTRLSPQASMILIQTRWHKDDLAGKTLQGELLLDAEDRRWRHINIPAISQKGISDALDRPEPGISMISARGRTKSEFEHTHKTVGDRVFLAMYQGSPTNPEGGLFARDWFEPPVEELPKYPVTAIVGIDPADSGEGDETGIIGGVLSGDGKIILCEDWSAQMTSDEWSMRAVEMALTIGAREIAMEGYSVFNTYRNVLKKAWADTHQMVREKLAEGKHLLPWELRALSNSTPFLVTKYTETGDAEGRASLMRRDFEKHRAQVIRYKMIEFVDQAADWQTGMHCPDRVSAAVITHWRLDQLGSGRMTTGHPLHTRPDVPPPSRLTRRISDPMPGSPGARFPFGSRSGGDSRYR